MISNELSKLSDQAKQRFEVRLTTKFMHLTQIIRADERILVGLYLSGKSGGLTPIFQLQGERSFYFSTYNEQFEIIWERARKMSQSQLQELVQKFDGTEHQ